MRRSALAIALLLAPALAHAAQDKVVRVDGTVTAQNYRALVAFLQDRFDQVVALSLAFPAGEAHAEGVLWAYEEGGMFVAYLPGPGNDSEISAVNGYVNRGDAFVFDRVYKVVYGGLAQGVVAVRIEPTLPPPGVPVERIGIDALKAPE